MTNDIFTKKIDVELTGWQVQELKPFITAMFDKKINPDSNCALVAQVYINSPTDISLVVIMADPVAAKEIRESSVRNVMRHKK